MYSKILVPHAGTKAGNKALEHAKCLAKAHGSKITILHVVEEIPTPPLISFNYEKREWAKQLGSVRRELKLEMHKRMEELAKDLRKEKIPTSVKVIHGYPDEEISRITNNDNYELIVMAKRKKLPGIKAVLKLGSVSRKVLEKIACPIMLIDAEK